MEPCRRTVRSSTTRIRSTSRSPHAGCRLLTAALLPLDCAASLASTASEMDDVSDQIWFNYILAFTQSEKLYVEVDVEAAAQVSGGEPWQYL